MKKYVCLKCGGDCLTGVIFLQDQSVICVSCVYVVLGGDNDNGHDWEFSVMHEVAERLRDEVLGSQSG